MKISRLLIALPIIVVAFLFILHPVFTAEQPGATPPTPKPPAGKPSGPPALSPEELEKRIAELIKQLGDDEWEKREAAQAELSKIGEAARKQLEEAKKNTDEEIALRAGQLLEELALANVTLLVTDKKGQPVAEKKINLILNAISRYGMVESMMGSSAKPITQEATLSKEGKVQLEKTKAGDYMVAIAVDGYAPQALFMRFGERAATFRIVAHKGGTVKGRVVGASKKGEPAKGVTVSASGPRGTMSFKRGETLSAITDEKGEYVFENVPEGAVAVGISGNDYYIVGPDTDMITIVEGQPVGFNFEVRPCVQPFGVVQFKVLLPDGKPYKGDVQLVFQSTTRNSTGIVHFPSGGSSSVQTADDGAAKFENIPPGKGDITLRVKGYMQYKVEGVDVKGGEATEIPDMKLAPGIPLKVKVTDSEGSPLAKALVFVADVTGRPLRISDWELDQALRHDLPTTGDRVSTKDDGTAVLDGLSPGKYALRVYVKDKGPSDEQLVELKSGAEPPVLVVKYAECGSVEFVAVDKGTGNEIKNFEAQRLNEYASSRSLDTGEEHITIESSDATIHVGGGPEELKKNVVEGCRKGEKIVVKASRYKPLIYQVGEPGMQQVAVKLEKIGKGSLKMTVVPGKGLTLEDISGVYVNSFNAEREQGGMSQILPLIGEMGKEAAASGKGVYEIKDAPEGPCYISILDKKRNVVAMLKASVEKDKKSELTLNLPGVGKVEGTLCDDEGNALPSTMLLLVPDKMMTCLMSMITLVFGGNAAFPVAMTDADGRFSFDNVPAGPYVLYQQDFSGVALTRLVDVKAGESVKIDFRTGKPIDVTVNLKLPAGQQMPYDTKASMFPVATNPLRSALLGMALDYNGQVIGQTARFWGVIPGKYRVWIGGTIMQSPATREIEVTPGMKAIDMDLSFERGKQSISGRVPAAQDFLSLAKGMNFNIVFAAAENWFTAASIMPDGSFKLTGLRPGKYRIAVLSLDEMCTNSADLLPAKEVTVAEGKDVEGLTIP